MKTKPLRAFSAIMMLCLVACNLNTEIDEANVSIAGENVLLDTGATKNASAILNDTQMGTKPIAILTKKPSKIRFLKSQMEMGDIKYPRAAQWCQPNPTADYLEEKSFTQLSHCIPIDLDWTTIQPIKNPFPTLELVTPAKRLIKMVDVDSIGMLGYKYVSEGLPISSNQSQIPEYYNPFASKKVDSEPQILNLADVQQQIGYPQLAKYKGIEGTVHTRVLVDSTGKFVKHMILKSPDKSLDMAVSGSIYYLKFTPALYNGKPVAYWLNIPFEFVLANKTN
jgi:TonB family protein